MVVTGYKQHELGIFDQKHPGIHYIKKALQREIESQIETGLEWVIISGQLGVEIWAAEVVMELQMEYPHLKYAVITPFLEQEKNWNEANQLKYEEILMHADYVAAVTKRPYEGPWQFTAKNKFLIQNSDGLLIVYDEEKGGTPKYIKEMADRYAENHDYEIIVIDSYDLQMIVEEEMYEW